MLRVEFASGVVISIIASVFCSIGFLLQKLSHIRRESRPRPRYCNAFWLSGMLCLVFASLLDYIALAFVAQSVIAPLGAVTLICNLVLGPAIIGERLTMSSIRATCIIMIGNSLSIYFFCSGASHNLNVKMTSIAIAERAFDVDVLLYAIGTLTLLITLKLFGRDNRLQMAIIAGMIAATSMMTARMLALITRDSLEHGYIVRPDVTATVVVLVVVSLLAQLRQMDNCLARFDATYVVPISQSSMCLFSIANGMLFFKEYQGLRPIDLAFFGIGVAITLKGQLNLSRIPVLSTKPELAKSDLELEQRSLRPLTSLSRARELPMIFETSSSDSNLNDIIQERIPIL